MIPGRVAKLVTYLTVDPGVVSLIRARSHTLAEIDREIISTAIFSSLPLIQEGLLSVKKVWLGEISSLTSKDKMSSAKFIRIYMVD